MGGCVRASLQWLIEPTWLGLRRWVFVAALVCVYLSTGRLMTEVEGSCAADRTWREILAPPERDANRVVLASTSAITQLGVELYDIEREPHHTFSKAVARIGRYAATTARCVTTITYEWADLLLTHYVSQSYCALRWLSHRSSTAFESLSHSVSA
jgi:hypothetical protein